jgi:hypothetical protein
MSFAERLARRSGRAREESRPVAAHSNATDIIREIKTFVNDLVEPAIQRLRSSEHKHQNEETCFSSAGGTHLRFRCCVYFTALAAGLLEQHFSAQQPISLSTVGANGLATTIRSASAAATIGVDAAEMPTTRVYGAMARWLLQPPPGASEAAFLLAGDLIAEASSSAATPPSSRPEHHAHDDASDVGEAKLAHSSYSLANLSAAASQLPGPLGRYSAPLSIAGVLGTLWRCEVSTVHTYLVFEAPGLAESVLIDVTHKQFLVIPEWMEERHFEAARELQLLSHLPDAFVGTAAELAELMTLPALEAALRSVYVRAGDDPDATLSGAAARGTSLHGMHTLLREGLFALSSPARRRQMCGSPSQHPGA